MTKTRAMLCVSNETHIYLEQLKKDKNANGCKRVSFDDVLRELFEASPKKPVFRNLYMRTKIQRITK